MSASRKLQGEIERTLKKIDEGIQTFDEIWDKVYTVTQQNLKDKHEADLKKEIKKLQRLRDQLKTWINGNPDIKDKSQLHEARRTIERKMEQFKVCERETKTKAFSREGLAKTVSLDPREQARMDCRDWLVTTIDRIDDQIEATEAEIEQQEELGNNARGKNSLIRKCMTKLTRFNFHQGKLELVIRLIDNNIDIIDQVDSIKESIEYFLDKSNHDDEAETSEIDETSLYETFDDYLMTGAKGEEGTGMSASGSISTSAPINAVTTSSSSLTSSSSVIQQAQSKPSTSLPPKSSSKLISSPTSIPLIVSSTSMPVALSLPVISLPVISLTSDPVVKITMVQAQTSQVVSSHSSSVTSNPPVAVSMTITTTVTSSSSSTSNTTASTSQQPRPAIISPALTSLLTELSISLVNLPGSSDRDRPQRSHVPRQAVNSNNAINSLPQLAIPLFDSSAVYEKLSNECLFVSFHYSSSQLYQLHSSRVLKKRGWRYYRPLQVWVGVENGASAYFDPLAGIVKSTNAEFKLNDASLFEDELT